MTIAERIKRFVELKNEAKSKIYEASLEYVSALDEHAKEEIDVTSEFMKVTKLSRQSLRIFEDIGRGIRDYRLLFEPPYLAKVIERMPMSLQQKILNNRMVEVYEPNSGSSLMVDYTNLTKQQLKMVFSKNNIRDIGGQRNYYETELNRLEEVKDEIESLEKGKCYSITAGNLYVKRNTKFTKQQLKNIVCKMYGVAKLSDIKD